MMVIVTENAPPRLRLSLWLLELRAGVYAGDYNRRTRERIWAEVKSMIGEGNAVIAWTALNEAGFSFETVGTNRREEADFDGFMLVKFKPPARPDAGAPRFERREHIVNAGDVL